MYPTSLEIPRGAVFYAHQWVLVDETGQPLRPDPARSLIVVSKVRREPEDEQILHVFATQAVQMVVPDAYDDQPVMAAQINSMTAEQTGALTFDRGFYDVLVNGHRLFPPSPVVAPWVVSR